MNSRDRNRAFWELSPTIEHAFKFILASVGVSLVSSVIFVVSSGVVIFVFEGHDLNIGKPSVEGEVPVACTEGGQ